MANKKSKAKKPAVKAKKPVKALAGKVKAISKKAASKPVAKAAPKTASKPKLQHGNLTKIFTPLDDRVLIEVDREEKTAGGLFIPTGAGERPQRGTVLAVGRGRRNKKGVVRPMDVKRGDEVFFAAFSGTPVEFSGRDIIILREADLLGVVE